MRRKKEMGRNRKFCFRSISTTAYSWRLSLKCMLLTKDATKIVNIIKKKTVNDRIVFFLCLIYASLMLSNFKWLKRQTRGMLKYIGCGHTTLSIPLSVDVHVFVFILTISCLITSSTPYSPLLVAELVHCWKLKL